MLRGFLRLVFLLLAAATLLPAQQSSGLVGTWVGKVQGFEVEMRLALSADGTADFEGVQGSWRVQGNKLLLTQEGETVAYDFRLQGTQLVLSGGDLMAPLALARVGGGPAGGRAAVPAQPAPQAEESFPEAAPDVGPTEEAAEPMPTAPKPAARQRGLTEGDLTELLEGGVPARRVTALVEERGVAFNVTPAAISRLKAKGATNELIAALRNAGGSQAEPPASASRPSASGGLAGLGQSSARQPAGDSAAGRAPGAGGLAGLGQTAGGQRAAPTRAPAAASRGNRFNHDKWGLSFVVPAAWKTAERQGVLLLGSDTETGLMIIRFMRRTNLQMLAQGYQEGMQEEGLQLMPATQLENFSAGGAQGLAGELAGTAQDGARIRARAIGVVSPYGDAAVVFGLTTEAKYAGLKPRVDALAASFFFSQPQTPPVLEAIAGQYFFFTSSSVGGSYSREAKLNLCSDGTFNRGGETYSSGAAGTAAGQSGSGGQWSAQGDESQGVLTLTYDNGETQELEYVVSNDPSDQSGYGPAVTFGNTKYQRTGDGSCR